MSPLDPTIEDFISTFEETSRKEIKFITDNNWINLTDPKIRESRHDLQHLLTDRNTLHAIKLFALCKGDIKHPRVSSIMTLLLSFFKIYEKRKVTYLKKENWVEYLNQGKNEVDMRNEIEFQSAILRNISDYNEKLRKINFGEESSTVIDIRIFGDIPIPLMMSDILEERYPEIKDYLVKKREAEVIAVKTVKKKKS